MDNVTIAFSKSPLTNADLPASDMSGRFGAQTNFIGRVRRFNGDRLVVKLCYDLHAALARQVLAGIAAEAQQRWSREAAITILHSHSALLPGEISVIVDVQTPHRSEAFAMCRYIIDELKHRAPIWKKECYEDGETEWLDGHSLCQHS